MNAFDAFFNCGKYTSNEANLYFFLLHLARTENSGENVKGERKGEQTIEINVRKIIDILKVSRNGYYKPIKNLISKGLIALEKGAAFEKKSTITFLYSVSWGEHKGEHKGRTYKEKESFPPYNPLYKEKEINKEKDKSFAKAKVREKERSVSDEPDKPEPAKRFVPPTLEQVKERIKEKNYTFDAEAFIAFYQSKNWYVGKNKMKDWKAAMVTWQKRSYYQMRNALVKKQNLAVNDEWK